jgi:hypothetical protein
MNPKRSNLILTGALMLGLAACQNLSDSNLNDGDVRDVTDIFNRETEASVVGMSLSETVLGVGVSAPVARVQDTTSAHTQGLPAGCRTVISGSETDTDADGVPDDVTFQFSAVACARNLTFNRTRTLSGQVRLQDVNPNVKDGSYLETSTNFAFTEERNGNPSFSEIRNGTRKLTLLDAQRLTRENDVVTRLDRTLLPDQKLVNQMRFDFTSSGGAVKLNQPLPAGNIGISGGIQASRGVAPLRGFTVTTESALQYDPTCQEQRITGGVVVLRFTLGAIRIAFQPCGSVATGTRIL